MIVGVQVFSERYIGEDLDAEFSDPDVERVSKTLRQEMLCQEETFHYDSLDPQKDVRDSIPIVVVVSVYENQFARDPESRYQTNTIIDDLQQQWNEARAEVEQSVAIIAILQLEIDEKQSNDRTGHG